MPGHRAPHILVNSNAASLILLQNADVLKGAKLDLQLIQAELKRRLLSGELFLGTPVKGSAKQ